MKKAKMANAAIAAMILASTGMISRSASAEASPNPVPSATPSANSQVSTSPEEMLKVRDPFKQPEVEALNKRPRTDLERYAVDSFRMIAVLTGPKHMRAMVLAPDGKSFMVSEHMKIGVHEGTIRRITPDSVQVRERIVNILGQEENVDSEIKLVASSRAQASAGGVH
jgi:Tfp pilus assembly protein PilP